MRRIEEKIARAIGEYNDRNEDIYPKILVSLFKGTISKNTVHEYVREMVKDGKLEVEFKPLEHGTCKILRLVRPKNENIPDRNADAGNDDIPQTPYPNEKGVEQNNDTPDIDQRADEFAVRIPLVTLPEMEDLWQASEGLIPKLRLLTEGADILLELIGISKKKP